MSQLDGISFKQMRLKGKMRHYKQFIWWFIGRRFIFAFLAKQFPSLVFLRKYCSKQQNLLPEK